VKKLTLRAAAGQRPCLTFVQAGGVPARSSLRVASPLDELELNGLLISGGPLRLDGAVQRLCLVACTLDPRTAAWEGSLVAGDPEPNRRATYLLCRCITGGLRLGAGVGRLIVADSILDQQGGLAIGGLWAFAGPPASPLALSSPPGGGMLVDLAAGTVHLERVTVLGRVRCDVLNASECLLDELVLVEDQQAGCLRFSRYELGSQLPRRYQCVPSDVQAAACRPPGRCLAPLFNSRRFGRPDYAKLAAAGPPELLAASEEGSEIGAFTGARNTLRLANLETKLQVFLPVGLSAVVIAET
jgi:hypothetical protein